MLKQPIITIMVILFNLVGLNAQRYKADNLDIEICSKDNFIVRNFHDLDIKIVYKGNNGSKKISVYQYLLNSYRSPLGNCYFDILKFDSAKSAYDNITSDFIGTTYPKDKLLNEDEVLRSDIKKVYLKIGEPKTYCN